MCLMKNKTNPFEAIEIETEKKRRNESENAPQW